MRFHHAPSRDLGITRAILLTALAAGSSTLSSAASTDRLPSAAAVLNHYVEATGGSDALLRHTSMTIRGRYRIPDKRVDLETATYMKGDKAVWKFVRPDGKAHLVGYDGRTAWGLDPEGKVAIVDGAEVNSRARDADMYYHLHVLKYFRSMDVSA